MRLALLSLAVLLAPVARAECNITAGPGDRVAKGHDVVVESNETVQSAVAVDGNVIVRKGAHVKSAVALHGTVTIEAGARVDESVVAFGGTAKIDPSAVVKGSVISIGKRLHVRSEDGHSFDLAVDLDGESLARSILKDVLGKLDACVVEGT